MFYSPFDIPFIFNYIPVHFSTFFFFHIALIKFVHVQLIICSHCFYFLLPPNPENPIRAESPSCSPDVAALSSPLILFFLSLSFSLRNILCFSSSSFSSLIRSPSRILSSARLVCVCLSQISSSPGPRMTAQLSSTSPDFFDVFFR